jgi:prephenate dehydrogenase
MTTVGIIGAGSFGMFLAEKLDVFCDVKISSRSGKGGKWAASLEEVAGCDYIIPSIPVEAYESTLTTLKTHIKKDSVIVDICSVKEKPGQIIKKVLPDNLLVATHPLFGPESAKDTLKGHCLVLCPDVSNTGELEKIATFAEVLELDVIQMTAVEHDQEMAVVQGLTFFIARTLHEVGIHRQKLETPSFKRLLHLAELETHHTDDLFYTIQNGNDQTTKIRQKFIDTTNKLNAAINKKSQ